MSAASQASVGTFGSRGDAIVETRRERRLTLKSAASSGPKEGEEGAGQSFLKM
jgi:hypothetical protein